MPLTVMVAAIKKTNRYICMINPKNWRIPYF